MFYLYVHHKKHLKLIIKNICNSNSQAYLDNILLISEVHTNYQLLGDCIATVNKLYKRTK